MKRALIVLLHFTLISCAPLSSSKSLFTASDTVTATETIEIAEAYVSHRWSGAAENIFHGLDPNGVLVNTPDFSYKSKTGKNNGWWKITEQNIGIPYKWGGFDTPAQFDHKLSIGKYAGDVFTSDKRAKLNNAVSQYATGIDCSGFISRCWKLPKPYSTRTLPSLCIELEDTQSLRRGDILNKVNDHVILFSHFTGEGHFVGYEAVADTLCKVRRSEFILNYFIKNNYKPLRYKKLISELETE